MKTLSDNQHKKLLEAKAICQTETLEENKHTPQCNTIPFENNCNPLVHGIHLVPCYKKFTSILAPSRKRKETDLGCISNRLKHVKRSGSNTDIFPKVCFSCGLNRKHKSGKTYHAYNITTENATINIKIAAVKQNDKLRMIQFQPTDDELYKDPQYLIRKELMTHKDCYLDYIKCLPDNTSTSKDDAFSNIGNFSGVKH